jgi:hypothetical protein
MPANPHECSILTPLTAEARGKTENEDSGRSPETLSVASKDNGDGTPTADLVARRATEEAVIAALLEIPGTEQIDPGEVAAMEASGQSIDVDLRPGAEPEALADDGAPDVDAVERIAERAGRAIEEYARGKETT